ncbi:MAG TPA: tetratricopeptide repeat protein [Firmicutes bacterium]|nr:tetratricopeptide repeat protein [Bacillota bacterium]
MSGSKVIEFPVLNSRTVDRKGQNEQQTKSEARRPSAVVPIHPARGLGKFHMALASKTRGDGFVNVFLAWEISNDRLSVISLQLEYMYWLEAFGIVDFAHLPVMSRAEFEASFMTNEGMAEGGIVKAVSWDEAIYLIRSSIELGGDAGEVMRQREFHKFAWLLKEPVRLSSDEVTDLLRRLIEDVSSPIDVALSYDRASFTGDFFLMYHLLSKGARARVGSLEEYVARLKNTPPELHALPEDNDLLFDDEEGGSIRIEAARVDTGESVLVRRWLVRHGETIEIARRFDLVREGESYAIASPDPEPVSVEEFERVARRAILIDGDMAASSPREVAEWGNVTMRDGNYAQAVRILDAALEMEPRLFGARLQAADGYLRIERPDKAIQHLEALLRLAPPGTIYQEKAGKELNLCRALAKSGGELLEEPLKDPERWFDSVERSIIAIATVIKPGADVFREAVTMWNLFIRYCDVPLPAIGNPATWGVAALYNAVRLRGGDITRGDVGSFLAFMVGLPWSKLRKMADLMWDVLELYDDAEKAWFIDEVRLFPLDDVGYSMIFSHPSGAPRLVLANYRLKGKGSRKTLTDYLASQKGVKPAGPGTDGLYSWEFVPKSRTGSKGGPRRVQIAVDNNGIHLSSQDDETLSRVTSRLERDLSDHLVLPGEKLRLNLAIHYS